MKYVIEARDQVRGGEQRELRARGDRRLTGTKFLRLTTHVGRRDVSAASRRQFRVLRQYAQVRARGHSRKAFRHIWDCQSIPAAQAFFDRWQAWAISSRLRPMIHVAGIIRRHLENYPVHRITNGVTEGLDAKIQWIKYASRGFRDRERFKLAIDFHCGGLDLGPLPNVL